MGLVSVDGRLPVALSVDESGALLDLIRNSNSPRTWRQIATSVLALRRRLGGQPVADMTATTETPDETISANAVANLVMRLKLKLDTAASMIIDLGPARARTPIRQYPTGGRRRRASHRIRTLPRRQRAGGLHRRGGEAVRRHAPRPGERPNARPAPAQVRGPAGRADAASAVRARLTAAETRREHGDDHRDESEGQGTYPYCGSACRHRASSSRKMAGIGSILPGRHRPSRPCRPRGHPRTRCRPARYASRLDRPAGLSSRGVTVASATLPSGSRGHCLNSPTSRHPPSNSDWQAGVRSSTLHAITNQIRMLRANKLGEDLRDRLLDLPGGQHAWADLASAVPTHQLGPLRLYAEMLLATFGDGRPDPPGALRGPGSRLLDRTCRPGLESAGRRRRARAGRRAPCGQDRQVAFNRWSTSSTPSNGSS